MEKILKRGAEAVLILAEWSRALYSGVKKQVVLKERVPKRYRLPAIDEQLRRSRTLLEAKLLLDAKRAGVPTPLVFEIDKESARLVLEYVRGPQLKHVLKKAKGSMVRKLGRKIGQLVARLHRTGIVHGDLTTSNIILRKDGEICFVDFGLGEYDKSVEARAVDLHLFRRAVQSVHFEIFDQLYSAFLEGYREEFGAEADQIIKRADEIQKRGRYVKREERTWH